MTEGNRDETCAEITVCRHPFCRGYAIVCLVGSSGLPLDQ